MHSLRRAALASFLVLLAACDGPFTIIPPGFEDGASKSRDVVSYLARQRQAQVAFGNPEVGTAAGLGEKRTRLGARVSMSSVGSPQLGGVPMRVGDARESNIPVTSGTATSVALEGAARLYRGFERGESRLLSVDLLGRAVLASGLPESDLNISSSSFGGALGLRIGVTEDRGKMPAVSLVFMQGSVPGFTLASDPTPLEGGGSWTVTVDELKMRTNTARIATSKQFGNVGVTLGYGVDVLNTEATIETRFSGRPELGTDVASDGMNEDMRRSTLFGGVTYRMRWVTLGGELGVVQGDRGSNELNTFSSGGGTRSYLSVGARLGN